MKTLLLDIETAPSVADVWSLWNVNISLNQLRESSYVLCWAAKWLGQPEMMFGAVWYEHTEMLNRAYNLLEEAEAIVTYNGDKFDLPTLNKEFIQLGFTPPAPYRSIDVYKTVKSVFRFPSGKLQYVGQALGVGKKVEHEGHDLWVKVRSGDREAQRRMEEYCKGDVILLEKVFNRVRPWIRSVPNMGLYDGSECPRCNDGERERRGYAYTATGIFQRYRCRNCGGWSRDTRRMDGVDFGTV